MQNHKVEFADAEIKKHFDEWVCLLEQTGNKDLLEDPYNIWLEAFHVATMLAQKPILIAPKGAKVV